MALDPVCKMEVNEKESSSTQYNGTTFYFCSNACKDTFTKDPGKYTSSKHEHKHGAHGGHHCN